MQDRLSKTFAALADPTRRAILARLSQGEASVSDLAQPFLKSMSLPAVTKHLKVLEKAGLITKTREAQWRPCKLNGEGLKDISNWMEQYRSFWEESFDRLDEYLKTVKGKKNVQKKIVQMRFELFVCTMLLLKRFGTPGLIRKKLRNGGDHADSQLPLIAKTLKSVATGLTQCTVQMELIIQTRPST